ncbi:MAG: bifunctional alpha,alpha-trehalose-phosphate synthase (UDP-forming)/trehalose-phosphatase [Thermoplasmata archaeon]
MTLLLVSNRLPVTVRRLKPRIEFRPSVGGVAVGLSSIQRDHEASWVGWPGEIPASRREEARRLLAADFRCHPVFLREGLARRYYEGFSNRALWPLFHSVPTHATYASEEWEAYRKVNALFCDAVADLAEPGDHVWVHDYQLLLLPRLLRERLPGLEIGFFLHTPFPPFDLFRSLPWHREILEGLLGADLIGFHTYDYSQNFLRSVRRVLGIDNDIGRIAVGQRIAQADVFPMGIDFTRFSGTEATKGVAFLDPGDPSAARKVSFSLSRLDYTKGIPEQLRAIDRLLETHPEWRGRYQHWLVVVPSRERIAEYAALKDEIEKLVGRVNGRYGSLAWTPVRYVYRQLRFEDLLALYRRADIALITPLRDGMNLVAKEYLAARNDRKGVLVLSEMAGAARELMEALIVNPNDEEELARALDGALRMSTQEQIRRNTILRARLQENDLARWGERFLRRWDEVLRDLRDLSVRLLTPTAARTIARSYAKARRRLMLLDYDGTLVPLDEDPFGAAPPPKLLRRFRHLVASPRNSVVLLSGRRKEELEGWFGRTGLILVAEHGGWVRRPTEGEWKPTVPLDTRWKDRVRPILELFVERVPGSRIEEKDLSLAWHYRRADPETALAAAGDLTDALTHLTANAEIHVLLGHKVVEVKSTRIGKGVFYSTHLAGPRWDFILAAGDDWTDEALFSALPPEAFSLRVGLTASAAKFNVESTEDVLALLERLARRDQGHANPPTAR